MRPFFGKIVLLLRLGGVAIGIIGGLLQLVISAVYFGVALLFAADSGFPTGIIGFVVLLSISA